MFGFRAYSRLIALPHSVFALPFALVALIVSYRRGPLLELAFSPAVVCLLAIVAVISARTAAMAFNRLLDAEIDAKNPRTKAREIPRGDVSKAGALCFGLFSTAAFVLAAYGIGWHCLVLSPFVLLVVIGYSFTKRYTNYSHLVLGLALALAPGGAWWVFRPEVELPPLILMAAVVFWVAGFDILYSCQDVIFDREQGIFSLPAEFGVARALKLARWFHLAAFLGLLGFGLVVEFRPLYFWGVGVLGLPLIFQHRLLSPFDLSRLNHAFFTFNGITSIGYLVLVLASLG